jgi:hypothetical protein
MRRPEAAAIAAARRSIAVAMRAQGHTYVAIGRHLQVTPGRAHQICHPVRHPGNPKNHAREPGTTTLSGYIERRVQEVAECVRAHELIAGHDGEMRAARAAAESYEFTIPKSPAARRADNTVEKDRQTLDDTDCSERSSTRL